MTVCFTGHRNLTEPESVIASRLDLVLETLYQQGYRRFFDGAALGFDLLAAERVAALRLRYPDVQLVLAIPFAAQAQYWSPEQAQRYAATLCLADNNRVLSQHYYQGCLMVRNRYMVDRSAFCVCYLNQMRGGTMSTAAYAAQQQLTMLNVASDDLCEAFVRRP